MKSRQIFREFRNQLVIEIEQFECSGVKEKSHLSGAVAIFFLN